MGFALFRLPPICIRKAVLCSRTYSSSRSEGVLSGQRSSSSCVVTKETSRQSWVSKLWNFARTVSKVWQMQVTMAVTVSFKYATLRVSGVMTFSQSHWVYINGMQVIQRFRHDGWRSCLHKGPCRGEHRSVCSAMRFHLARECTTSRSRRCGGLEGNGRSMPVQIVVQSLLPGQRTRGRIRV